MKPNEILTNERCDAFILEHRYVAIGSNDNHPPAWHIWETCGTFDNFHSYGTTRQEAITDFWRRYYPGWQPPEPAYDAEWALAYIDKHQLRISRYPVGDMDEWEYRVGRHPTAAIGKSLISAVEHFINKYAAPPPLPSISVILEQYRRHLDSDEERYRAELRVLEAVIEREKVNDGNQ